VIADNEDFSALPRAVARTLEGRRRVIVILLDAFGWRFVQRHARHPLLARLERDGTLGPLASQFPATTTAHVTTMHTGLPVAAHGLYEWRVWEPALRRVITPLLFSFAGDGTRDTLADSGLDPRAMLPQGPSFYQRLAARGIPSLVWSPVRFSPSTYDRVAARGATMTTYDELADGVRALRAAVAAHERCYAYLYFDGIDTAGHLHGPSSPEFDDAALRALDAVHAAFFGPGATVLDDTLLVLTADHGQVDVSQQRVDYLDVLWPRLLDVLSHDARGMPVPPAGSARDVFLHVGPEAVEEAVAELGEVLGDRGTVRTTADLLADGTFGPQVGPRLRERVGSVCVLPAAGRMAWLRSHPDVERSFLGHHGGLDPDEAQTFLGTVELG
jgi:Type I phosphodiesterase / nucleotide pyrophosphatase